MVPMDLSEAGAFVAAVAEVAAANGRDGSVPARVWVYRQVLKALQEGRLQPGQRLPSARKLAYSWRVARGAVDDAFAQLVGDGLVERRVGNGSFVVDALRVGALRAVSNPVTRSASPDANDSEPKPPPALSPLATDLSTFPLASWRRHLSQAMSDASRDVLSYGMPAGLLALREATARHLRLTRSIDCTPRQVVIVNSALHAIELIAQVLFEPGDRVCVEDPGFPDEAHLLTQAHLQLVNVPLDEDGFDVAAAQRLAADATAVFLHPLNQYPTGWRTSAERRRALLDWADQSGAWIIEGDHLAEIVPDGDTPAALWRSDRAERVLYIGTYNGVMFPSLRLAYVVVPEPLVSVFSAVRGILGDHSPTVTQAAMASFIGAGQLSARLRSLRALYAMRRLAFLRAAQRHLAPPWRLGPSGAGVHVSAHLDAALPDVQVASRLAAVGLRVQALSALCRGPRRLNGLVLGYGGCDEAQIEAALALVARHALPSSLMRSPS